MKTSETPINHQLNTELEMWVSRYRDSPSKTLRERAREKVLSLLEPRLYKLASKYANTTWLSEDLLQAAKLGVLDAMESWRKGEDVPFANIAIWRANISIFRHIRSFRGIIREPSWVWDARRAVKPAQRKLKTELGREPTVEELMDVTGKERYVVSGALRQPTMTVDKGASGEESDDSDNNWQDTVEESVIIRDCMMNLPEQERKVIVMRHYNGFTYKEVGKSLGCCESKAYNVVHQAEKALVDELAKQGWLEEDFS